MLLRRNKLRKAFLEIYFFSAFELLLHLLYTVHYIQGEKNLKLPACTFDINRTNY